MRPLAFGTHAEEHLCGVVRQVGTPKHAALSGQVFQGSAGPEAVERHQASLVVLRLGKHPVHRFVVQGVVTGHVDEEHLGEVDERVFHEDRPLDPADGQISAFDVKAAVEPAASIRLVRLGPHLELTQSRASPC